MTAPADPVSSRSGMAVRGQSSHRNNFGLLRLVFAALVVVGHSPEMIDGDRHREILTRWFGTISAGEFAVDGFFLVSGFLITGSFLSDPSLKDFLAKRALRIYPGFIVCALICLLAVAPVAGADLAGLHAKDWLRLGYRILRLDTPTLPDVFPAQPIHALNGALWTISYEARCYLLVAVLGLTGLLSAPRLVLGLSIALLAATIAMQGGWLSFKALSAHHALTAVIGDPERSLRLTTVFMSGACFRLFRDRFTYHHGLAVLALAGLVACLFWPALADAGVAVFGGYVVFWLAFRARYVPINVHNDISYGLYLYAWPIAALILMATGMTNPWLLTGLTLPLALLAGAASWFGIEKHAMKWKPGQARSVAGEHARVVEAPVLMAGPEARSAERA